MTPKAPVFAYLVHVHGPKGWVPFWFVLGNDKEAQIRRRQGHDVRLVYMAP